MCARPCLPVLLRAERGAAAPVAVDLLHSGADIIVAHVQHVEAGRRGGQQGRAVQQGQTALCQSRLHTHSCLVILHSSSFFFFFFPSLFKHKIENVKSSMMVVRRVSS